MTPLERLTALHAKVDAFFASAASAHPAPDGITCASGCHACCKRELTVTRLEADAIRAYVASLSPEAQAEVVAAIRGPRERDDCAALVGSDGRCAIYPARPLVCRTHGLAIRFEGEEVDGRRRLPVLDACPLNFTGTDLEKLPRSSVLEQATLSTVLGALDAAHADVIGAPRGTREDLRSLLARLPA